MTARQTGGAGVRDSSPAGTPTWSDLIESTARALGSRREARWMIEEAAGEPWDALSGPAGQLQKPTAESRLHLESMIERRLGGEPLQYVLGRWAFRTLDLMVDRRVLIPRPETEQVVEAALQELKRTDGRTVVDLGTGSGAIALSVAVECPGVEVWATDSSPAALDVARANLSGLAGFAATRVHLLQADWWRGLPDQLRGRVDLVVSNPPYISTREMQDLDPQVGRWEPAVALEAGRRGTEAIEAILADAPRWLSRRGAAVIEMAPHQAEQAVEAARAAGFTETAFGPDLAGRPRALIARGLR